MKDPPSLNSVARPLLGKALEALLAPKIARLREWASQSDLAGRAYRYRDSGGFGRYFEALRAQCGTLHTLVFPNQQLRLDDVYEPLRFVTDRPDQQVQCLGYDGPTLRRFRHVLIKDRAGMGKSTLVKHMCLAALAEPDATPVLVELRKLTTENSLMAEVISQFDDLDSRAHQDVLLHLLGEGGFILFLDGFDEIREELLQSVTEEILTLAHRAGNNVIVLTSRPEAPLEAFGGFQSFTIQPLDLDQARSLIHRYDEVAGIDVGERLDSHLADAPEAFIRNPLMVGLLYRTFGYSGEIATSSTAFYDELYQAFYKGHDLTKGNFRRDKKSGHSYEAFRAILRELAVRMTARGVYSFPSRTAAVQEIRLAGRAAGVSIVAADDVLDDLLLAVPFMLREGRQYRFVHKSIVDFFAAEAIVLKEEKAALLQMLKDSTVGARFAEALDFLADMDPRVFRRILLAPLAREFLAHCDRIRDDIPDRDLYCALTYDYANLTVAYPDKTHQDFPIRWFYSSTDRAEDEGALWLGERMGAQPPFPWGVGRLELIEWRRGLATIDGPPSERVVFAPGTLPISSGVDVPVEDSRVFRELWAVEEFREWAAALAPRIGRVTPNEACVILDLRKAEVLLELVDAEAAAGLEIKSLIQDVDQPPPHQGSKLTE